MQIKKQLIKYNTGGANKPLFIVIHETGNASVGSGAQNHYRYFNGGNRGASAHYIVDDTEIVQLVENNVKSWHNGKKYKPTAQLNNPECNNGNSIGIEICVNSDGDYAKARSNAIWLTKKLMKDLNIKADKVIRHYDSCGKQCPAKMLANPKLWEEFKQALKGSNRVDDEYIKAVDKMVSKGIVSSPDLWKKEQFNNNHVKSLIIKIGANL